MPSLQMDKPKKNETKNTQRNRQLAVLSLLLANQNFAIHLEHRRQRVGRSSSSRRSKTYIILYTSTQEQYLKKAGFVARLLRRIMTSVTCNKSQWEEGEETHMLIKTQNRNNNNKKNKNKHFQFMQITENIHERKKESCGSNPRQN